MHTKTPNESVVIRTIAYKYKERKTRIKFCCFSIITTKNWSRKKFEKQNEQERDAFEQYYNNKISKSTDHTL